MAVRKSDLLEGKILKELLLLFFPVYFGYLCQQLYTTFNTIIVGQYVGKQALAAVGGSTSTLISLLVNFVIGLSAGVTITVARYYVKRDYENIQKSVKTGFFIAIVLGAIVTVFGIVFSGAMLSCMNVPKDVFDYSLVYMRVYFLGMIPTFIYNVGASILRAVGDTKRPMYFLIISCISNILFGVLFVRVFDLGVIGVGLSTVLSQTISALLILLVFKYTSDEYSYSLKDFGYDKEILKKTITIGLPSGFQSVLYAFSNVFIQAAVNSFGTDTIAAYTAYGRLDAFYWDIESALDVAIMTMVAQNYGAGKIDRVKKIAKIDFVFYFALSALIGVIYYIFANGLISIFIDVREVIEIGVKMIRFVAIFYWMFAPINAFATTIKAVGHSLQAMIISGICVCGVRVGYLVLFNYNTVLEALYCYPLSWLVAGIVFTIYFFSNKWIKNE